MASSRKEIQAHQEEEGTVKEDNIRSLRSQGIGIRCPVCKGQTHVNNSVSKPQKSTQGRYRECDECKHRFYTEEKFVRHIAPRE